RTRAGDRCAGMDPHHLSGPGLESDDGPVFRPHQAHGRMERWAENAAERPDPLSIVAVRGPPTHLHASRSHQGERMTMDAIDMGQLTALAPLYRKMRKGTHIGRLNEPVLWANLEANHG